MPGLHAAATRPGARPHPTSAGPPQHAKPHPTASPNSHTPRPHLMATATQRPRHGHTLALLSPHYHHVITTPSLQHGHIIATTPPHSHPLSITHTQTAHHHPRAHPIPLFITRAPPRAQHCANAITNTRSCHHAVNTPSCLAGCQHPSGGTVINAAIIVDGECPIGAKCCRLEAPYIRVSIDDGASYFEWTCLEQLADFHSPLAAGALAKCVCLFCGLCELHHASSLEAQLRAAGGGIELVSWSRLPTGSGLGTSSILAGALVSCVGRALGKKFSSTALIHAVLQVFPTPLTELMHLPRLICLHSQQPSPSLS